MKSMGFKVPGSSHMMYGSCWNYSYYEKFVGKTMYQLYDIVCTIVWELDAIEKSITWEKYEYWYPRFFSSHFAASSYPMRKSGE